jgi:uncharacterized protein (DUF433 family)
MSLPDLPPFLTRWPDGEVVVTGTRVLLFYVVLPYREGLSAESIAVRYPTIPLATVHKVIAFYLENQAAVEQFVTEYQIGLDQLRAAGTKLDLDVFRQRLANRQKSAG